MHNLTKSILSLAILVLSIGSVYEARADEVVITSGFVTISGPLPPGRGTFRSTVYSLTGDNFTVSGAEGDGVAHDVMSPCIFVPCPAGTLISANSIVLLQGVGPATINGMTFPLTTPFGVPLTFTTPTVAIPIGGDIVTVTTPFTMTGTLSIFALPGGTPIFSTTVSGSGIATLTLQAFEGGHVLTTIRYDFQTPIPEPATLLLFGTSLVGLATGAWHRHKRVKLH